jgi:hypothetical protein
MTGFGRLLNCVLLLILTGATTMWLRTIIEPYLPPGEWHAMLTGLFICVLWPGLTWSLRSLARVDLADPDSVLWWWCWW